jgi:hypothetical protein
MNSRKIENQVYPIFLFLVFFFYLKHKKILVNLIPNKPIFLEYSTNSKRYGVYNLKTQTMERSMHIIFDEFDDLITQTNDYEQDTQRNWILCS